MAEGDFQTYIKRKVRGRRVEFREFLRVELAPYLTAKAKARDAQEGGDQKSDEVRPEDVTDKDIVRFLQESREKRMILYDHVSKFLDLAPCTPGGTDWVDGMQNGEIRAVDSAEDIYSKTGPPITHPSAGLSYLRTNAYLENNPVYGPQQSHRPVKVRVMSLKSTNTHVGVGGFVAYSEKVRTTYATKAITQHGHKDPGGPTIWINVKSAHIDSTGRVVVHNEEANSDAQRIERERQGEERLFRAETEESLLAAEKLRGEGDTTSSWPSRGPSSSKAVRSHGPVQYAKGRSSYGMEDTGEQEYW